MADNDKDRRTHGMPLGDPQRQRTGQEAGAGQGPKGGPGKAQPGPGGGKAPMGGGPAKATDVNEDELGGESGDVHIELDDDDRITQRNPAQRDAVRH